MNILRDAVRRIGSFRPDFIFADLSHITPALLRERGIGHLVLDVDDTLVPYNGDRIDDTTARTLRELAEQADVRLFIASNSRRNLDAIGRQIGAEVITCTRLSRKPLARHYRRILDQIGCRPHEAAMVGDRLTTDILGGNLAGMTTILVSPFAGAGRGGRS